MLKKVGTTFNIEEIKKTAKELEEMRKRVANLGNWSSNEKLNKKNISVSDKSKKE